MPIVNYVREHIRFMEYATDEHLTASERLLWYALMHVMNQRAQGKVWPEEFIRISNDRLLSYCPMKYDTLAAARNSLKQRGLIEYTKGEKNKLSPAYRMVYFYPEYVAPDTESDTYPESNTEKSDNIGSNIGGNIGGNTGYNNINYTNNKFFPNPLERDWEEEEDREADYARAQYRTEVAAAWKEYFGANASPAMKDTLAWRAGVFGFGPGVLSKIIELCAVKNPSSPMDYILSVLYDWGQHKVKTVADAEQYKVAFDAINGKLERNGIFPNDGVEMLRVFNQEREADACQ